MYNKDVVQFFLFLGLGFLLAHVFQISTKKWAMWDKKVGWQFHHSLFGLAVILLSLFLPYKIQLISFGLGIIAEHTLKCGLVFIRKW